MKRILLMLILFCMTVFLISCTTTKKLTETASKELQEEKQVEAIEYAKLIFMGDECVGWFSPGLKIIGLEDMREYLKKNNIGPTETVILNHFVSLGWEIAGKNRPDEYTIEYKLKRK